VTTIVHSDLTALLLSLAVLLAVARALGEIVRRLGQPAVLGEILAGILVGPTVLGRLAPDLYFALVPASGQAAVALEAVSTLGITLFLLVAGIEVDLSAVWKQGKLALSVGAFGMVVPFGLGFAAASLAPTLLGMEPGADRLVFALFLSTALSISALPVIARTLIDLDLYRTHLGMRVMPAAVLQDVAGWLVFAVVLSMMGGEQGVGIEYAVILTLGFAAAMLTVGRWLIDRTLPWIQAHLSWPGGVIGFALSLTLFGAAFTEWVGIHAIFGAFFVGIAIGDSKHLRSETRFTIESFISFFFAPIFFASIGLRVDFLQAFSPLLVIVVLAIAIAGKFLGCLIGARIGRLGRRESWAIASAMNARGAMEIILGLLALQYGVIGERMFVALVVMALVTSLMGGPMIQLILGRGRALRFGDFLSAQRFLPALTATGRFAAIRELTAAASTGTSLDQDEVAAAVNEREEILSTGIGQGVAIPHARIRGLVQPISAVGLSAAGIDFDAPDGRPAHIVCLLLVPEGEDVDHLKILADVSRTFASERVRALALAAATYTEFRAALNVGATAVASPEHEA
jgi:Kef-type K+ transport system membrane component KefB/mannitol/fructose-specific phosphotransferase system IIA component